MKGVCDYKVIRNGQEINCGSKHNVVFDIPKRMADDFFKIRNVCIGSGMPGYNASYIHRNTGLFQRSEVTYLNMFKGIKLYDEDISLENPCDVRVPVLMAGPTKNASAPATQAQASATVNSSKIVNTATWSISGAKTIRSISLCNAFSGENMGNSFDAADQGGGSYFETASSNGTCTIGRIISNSKAITKWLVYGNEYAYVRGCNLSADFSKMTLKPIPAFYKMSKFGTWGFTCGFFVNPAKTKAYIIDSSSQSGACAIYVYNIADWTLDKTYTIVYNTSNAILFTDEADYLYSCPSDSPTVSVYSLSRSDNTKTLLTTVTKNVTSSCSTSGLTAMNNRLVAYADGDIIGLPVLVGETYTCKQYYSYKNSDAWAPLKMCIQADGDNVIIPAIIHAYSTQTSEGQSSICYFNCIMAPLWLNTTALNFDSPIELEDGDIFVISYSVGLGNLVTFNSNGGSSINSQIIITSGTATEPTAPTKDGYTFDGWYSDVELTSAFSFSTTITADTILYAKWI